MQRQLKNENYKPYEKQIELYCFCYSIKTRFNLQKEVKKRVDKKRDTTEAGDGEYDQVNIKYKN